ncbi:hypothetical protein WOLCODRAFT_164865, partial [Wolfiporia cocos MD-104 SS10]
AAAGPRPRTGRRQGQGRAQEHAAEHGDPRVVRAVRARVVRVLAAQLWPAVPRVVGRAQPVARVRHARERGPQHAHGRARPPRWVGRAPRPRRRADQRALRLRLCPARAAGCAPPAAAARRRRPPAAAAADEPRAGDHLRHAADVRVGRRHARLYAVCLDHVGHRRVRPRLLRRVRRALGRAHAHDPGRVVPRRPCLRRRRGAAGPRAGAGRVCARGDGGRGAPPAELCELPRTRRLRGPARRRGGPAWRRGVRGPRGRPVWRARGGRGPGGGGRGRGGAPRDHAVSRPGRRCGRGCGRAGLPAEDARGAGERACGRVLLNVIEG